ncbi:MAG: hypothetical protein EOO50_01420 [Flavobacterium sp.]|uniref:nuclear transport factor 2 family protein n=1 Tax=Flavobacterium sp. TaxID=239 RepID=UPI0012090226|nr:nuclear transport factor 2 family protein [Flavobacterium sp.]RZJ68479.1 MAG: hypothetical protein EOO50_01420 [Flavobacterium sp.]
MKNLYFFLLLAFISASAQKPEINKILDDWHKAAAEANFKNYFGAMSDDAIYIGTDATENWHLDAFKAFSKPYFDKGKAWNFKALERNIYFSPDATIAWFDELLDTHMKICRGSGVLRKEKNGQWKIVHYVLSMTVPNDKVDDAIAIKAKIEDAYTEELRKRKK